MSDSLDTIRARVKDHADAVSGLDNEHAAIAQIAASISTAFRTGNKLLLCGNGGSAADAQHVAAEFVGRFKAERKALPAIALTANTSALTAIGNDYGFEYVFSRQVEALARKGDVVVAISTSGNSKNVLNAVSEAKKIGCVTVGVTGKGGEVLAKAVDICFHSPSADTPRIQEIHILMWHIVCELVEEELAK